ncbi:MAG: DUF6174 domain-containing protein [Isosphaeraceae bacterium]
MTRQRVPYFALVLLVLAGCAGGEEVNTRTIKAAERTWQASGIKDYNLEWTTSGIRENHYRVFVRDGQVRAIYLVQPDGREIVAKPGEPQAFGVEGLFRTIEEELDMALSDNPFGQPKGTRVVLKFTPDPRLGYPTEFHRDVIGGPRGLVIHVTGFDPKPAPAIPPPKA